MSKQKPKDIKDVKFSQKDVENFFNSIHNQVKSYYLPTKEGEMLLHLGDYIATGVKGEHLAIDKDIFEKTYERVD